MARKYDVAVILVNYNSSDFTLNCVASIFEKTSSSVQLQVIVIDNNSPKAEFEKLTPLRSKEHVVLFQGKLNVGFSGANMLGVQFADAEFYYFLNNDCLLLNDCISILKKFMEAEPRAANCSGEMFIANGDYEYNFRYFPSLALKLLGSGLLRIMNPGAYPSRHKRFQVPTRVDLVNGSSMFIRATAFEEIGGFDTNYFLYCEEEDIALRFYRKGYGTFIIPEARYQHFVSKSTTSNNQISLPYLKEYYISFFYYFRKNYNYFYAGLMRLYFVIKIGVKFYKTLDYLRLALFIAGGCHMKHSLRFTQKITNH